MAAFVDFKINLGGFSSRKAQKQDQTGPKQRFSCPKAWKTSLFCRFIWFTPITLVAVPEKA
jgi:hypothetical protein